MFINTGRVFAHLTEIRSQVEADGFLCGCGTCVVAEGRVLYHYHIPRERGLAIKRDIDACGLDGALEGMEGVYVHRTPSRLPQVEQLKADLQKSGSVSPYSWEDDCYDVDKFYIGSDEKSQCRELFGRLKDMDVIDRGGGFYECVPRGHSKAKMWIRDRHMRETVLGLIKRDELSILRWLTRSPRIDRADMEEMVLAAAAAPDPRATALIMDARGQKLGAKGPGTQRTFIL